MSLYVCVLHTWCNQELLPSLPYPPPSQLATGVQDLGLLYPVPYFDAGTTVLVIVNSLDQPRSSQGQSLKWSTVSKLCRKKNSAQIPASVLQVGGPIPDRLALDAQVLSLSLWPQPRAAHITHCSNGQLQSPCMY